jgi:ATP-dependent protease ClpP protease subunit
MKKYLVVGIALLMVIGCAGQGQQRIEQPPPVEHQLTIKVISEDGKPQTVQVEDGDKVVKSMTVRKSGYALTRLSAIYGNKLYIKLFSGLSVADVTHAWSDMLVAQEEYGFTEGSEVHLFIDSPGGDAFSGLALTDLIEFYKTKGWKFVAHGTGIIASAAVPIFAVCNETHATKATIFMVHEAALWKWPGRESASDIRAQGKLMDLLQNLYLEKLVRNSNLTIDQWILLEAKTSWFSVERAVEIGILDYID